MASEFPTPKGKYEEGALLLCEKTYYPVVMGEKIHDRFIIVHKIGYDPVSTTWLAQDQNCLLERPWVMLRIISANETAKTREHAAYDQIKHLLEGDGLKEHMRGGGFIEEQLRFFIRGPKGEHLCLVWPMMGPTLDSCGPFDYFAAMRISEKVTKDLMDRHKTHERPHLAVSTFSIMFRMNNDFRSCTIANIHELCGDPKSSCVRTNLKQSWYGRALEFLYPTPDYKALFTKYIDEDADVSLIEWDGSVPYAKVLRRDNYALSKGFLAPEVVAKKVKAGKPADVWSLGCVMVFLLTGKTPDIWTNTLFRNDDGQWTVAKGKSLFAELDEVQIGTMIDQLVEQMPKPSFGFNPTLLKDLFNRIFVLDPEQRITAEKIHEHAWFM